jgi:hypothetical protein
LPLIISRAPLSFRQDHKSNSDLIRENYESIESNDFSLSDEDEHSIPNNSNEPQSNQKKLLEIVNPNRNIRSFKLASL